MSCLLDGPVLAAQLSRSEVKFLFKDFSSSGELNQVTQMCLCECVVVTVCVCVYDRALTVPQECLTLIARSVSCSVV